MHKGTVLFVNNCSSPAVSGSTIWWAERTGLFKSEATTWRGREKPRETKRNKETAPVEKMNRLCYLKFHWKKGGSMNARLYEINACNAGRQGQGVLGGGGEARDKQAQKWRETERGKKTEK